MARFIFNPAKPAYSTRLCGLDFGPDEGHVKPGAVVEMDPSDFQFSNWNEHVSGAPDPATGEARPCFIPAEDIVPESGDAPKPAAGVPAKPARKAGK